MSVCVLWGFFRGEGERENHKLKRSGNQNSDTRNESGDASENNCSMKINLKVIDVKGMRRSMKSLEDWHLVQVRELPVSGSSGNTDKVRSEK